MKKFLINFIKFLLIPISIIAIFDFWLKNQDTLYGEKLKGLKEKGESIEVLVLGNSRACYGVNPMFFNNVTYNLASPSQTLYFDKRLTLSNLNILPSLKYVLISVDYHSLHSSSQGYRDFWSYYGNKIKLKDKKYWCANLSPFLFGYTKRVSVSMLKTNIKNKLKYKNRHFLDLIDLEYSRVNVLDSIYNGFIGAEGTSDKKFNTDWYLGRIKKHSILDNEVRNNVITDLNDFISTLIKQDVTPVLFASPTYSEYNQYLDDKIISRNTEDINLLVNKYHLEYWDFANDKRFLKHHFNDPDHLNKKGAELLSKLLNERIYHYEHKCSKLDISNKKKTTNCPALGYLPSS